MKYILLLFSIVFSGGSLAEIKSRYNTNYYHFDAESIENLVENVKKTGPKMNDKTVWAKINWELHTEYYFESNETSCHILIESMELVATLQLPNWRDIKKQSLKTRDWWGEYSSFILEHENSHFDNALLSAQRFETKLLDIPAQLSCKKAELEYFALKEQFISDVSILDKETDLSAKRIYKSNHKLFSPLKGHSSVVFESGGMSSYITL